MIVMPPQFEIVWFSIEMSLVLETKLLPEDRDSQTVCGNALHGVVVEGTGMIPAAVRSTPNSANCPATRFSPLIGLSAALIADWLASPSAELPVSVCLTAPQHGGMSLPTKHVALAASVPSIQVRML